MNAETAVNDGLKVAAEVAPLAGPQAVAAVTAAEAAAPLVEQVVNFLIGLFKQHAPKATAEQILQAATTHAQLAVSQLAGLTGTPVPTGTSVAQAAATAAANPPAPKPGRTGVTFSGQGSIQR